jgi:hypothetical protein
MVTEFVCLAKLPATVTEDEVGDRNSVWEARRYYMWLSDKLTLEVVK